MDTVYVVGGTIAGISGTVATTGSNAGMNWQMSEDGATKSKVINPVGGAVLRPNANVALSGNGSVGDYLKSVHVTNRVLNRSGVFLNDGLATAIASGALGFSGVSVMSLGTMSGATGTAPGTGTPGAAGTVTLAATANVTTTLNALAGFVLSLTYTPTGGTACTEKKTIVGNTAVTAGASITFTFGINDFFLPSAAVTGAWMVESPCSTTVARCIELIPFDSGADRMDELHLGISAQLGALSISTTTSQVVAVFKGTD